MKTGKTLTPITIHPFHTLWDTDAANSVEVLLQARCKRKGHNFEDRSHFGPDSGSESHVCTSCGFTIDVTWY
jgi:hypothetical protein